MKRRWIEVRSAVGRSREFLAERVGRIARVSAFLSAYLRCPLTYAARRKVDDESDGIRSISTCSSTRKTPNGLIC